MTDTQIVDFAPEHLDKIELIDDPNAYISYFPKEYLIAQYNNGPAATLIHRDKIVACGGFTLVSPGVASAWLWGDKSIENSLKLTKWLYIASHNLLNRAYKEWSIHRLQAYIFQNRPKAIRFVENLGFTKEGTMEYYGPNGEHVDMYAYFPAR